MTSFWRHLTSNQQSITDYNTDAMEDKKLIRSWGYKGQGKGQFNMPTGICVTRSDNVIIVDTENRRVQMFNQKGEFLQVIASEGTLPHELCYPLCAAIIPEDEGYDGTILVITDGVHACVKIYHLQEDTSECHFISSYGQGCLKYPSGVTVLSDKTLAVTDLLLHAVVLISYSGDILKIFGRYGQGDNEFDHPCFITVNKNDQIIVSDTGNTSIKIFSRDGTLSKCFKQEDFRLDSENCLLLYGVHVDNEDHLLVIANTTVYIAAKDGRFWEVLIPSDGLHGPRDLTLIKDNLIVTQYDLQSNRHQVCVFKYYQEHFQSLKSVLKITSSISKTKLNNRKRTRKHTASSCSESESIK